MKLYYDVENEKFFTLRPVRPRHFPNKLRVRGKPLFCEQCGGRLVDAHVFINGREVKGCGCKVPLESLSGL